LACWVQTPPVLVHIQAAPALLLSLDPPTMAVLPSPEGHGKPLRRASDRTRAGQLRPLLKKLRGCSIRKQQRAADENNQGNRNARSHRS